MEGGRGRQGVEVGVTKEEKQSVEQECPQDFAWFTWVRGKRQEREKYEEATS